MYNPSISAAEEPGSPPGGALPSCSRRRPGPQDETLYLQSRET